MSYRCSSCQKQFTISEKEISFLDKISPVINGQKFQISQPDMCDMCRSQYRTLHRNEQYLYHNKSNLSEKLLISLYSPNILQNENTKYKVFTEEEWISDEWDAMEHGQDFDFSRGFFEQFYELDKKVPRANLMTVVGTNENSPYTTGTGYCKNCHIINSSENCEDCYYGKLLQICKNVVDSTYVYDSELVYEGFDIRNCYNCLYLSHSQNCSECYFSEDLKSCKNCFLCSNMSQKQYCFQNQQMVKEDYFVKVNEYLGSYTKFKEARGLFMELRKRRAYKYANIVSCENCTGDFLRDSKNCENCYDVTDSEDCMNVQIGVNVKDVFDCSNMYINPELCYQSLGTLEVYNVIFSIYIFHSQNVLYSQQCYNCKNIFGCSGLKRKEYCILNKQYTREQYESLVPQIINHMNETGEWGKFFPSILSPFGYNETLASDYFPLTRDQAISKGFKWREKDASAQYEGPDHVFVDNIKDVPENIIESILRCEITGELYKIMPQELKFYKNMNIPLPRRCPNQRHLDRMKLRNQRLLFDRNCMKCHVAIKTIYSTERLEKVFCEKCYLGEVY